VTKPDEQVYDVQFMERYQVRTDLALEAHEVIVEHQGPPEITGVVVENEETPFTKISRVSIRSDEGAQLMGKMKGNYITIESEALRNRSKEAQEEVSQTLAKELASFLQMKGLSEDAATLLVGLGNWNATPDAVGPKVVEQVLVTRHLYELSPPELRGGLRPLSAIAPGVLGLTGIETGEIVKGIVDKIRPQCVICVDALASRSTTRVCSTIQISDTGIHPGSGVGNKRMAITHEALGVPVIAIGVPTVVNAVTIASDAMELLAQEMGFRPKVGLDQTPQAPTSAKLDPQRIRVRMGDTEANGHTGGNMTGDARYDAFGLPIDPQQKRYLISRLLQPYMGSMIVTPKDIDTLIADVSSVVAGGINAALHPAIDLTDILNYLASH
jgi:spore protease